MSDTEPAVRLRSYGGLRMWRAGAEVDIGAPRLRTLLAALLAARGGVVGVDALIDLIWGAEPSPSAVNQLHRLVGQVRRLFEPELPSRAAGRWVQPAGQGYRLVAHERTCDLMAVGSLWATARAAASARQVREAAQAYARALELAREPVFAGLGAEVLDQPAFVALRQERIRIAVEAADLALIEPAAVRVVPLLHRIAVSAPLHEPLQARMVRLLTVTGRRAEALILFDEVRRLLADELGADPGAELRSAHLVALADDDQEPPAAHRPVQLPRRVAGFVARGELPSADSGIVVLSGMGGIGKTALAVDWAHRLAPRYPDGQLYVNLRGFDPSGRLVEPSDALNVLLESLGVTLAAMAGADVDTRAARLRSVLADRRMILLLANARDSEQVRPLLPGASGCLVIVTSRNRMTGLVAHEGARPVIVGRLGDAAALELLAKRIGAPRLSAQPEAARVLVRFCAGLPLALAIAAAYAAVRPRRAGCGTRSTTFCTPTPGSCSAMRSASTRNAGSSSTTCAAPRARRPSTGARHRRRGRRAAGRGRGVRGQAACRRRRRDRRPLPGHHPRLRAAQRPEGHPRRTGRDRAGRRLPPEGPAPVSELSSRSVGWPTT